MQHIRWVKAESQEDLAGTMHSPPQSIPVPRTVHVNWRSLENVPTQVETKKARFYCWVKYLFTKLKNETRVESPWSEEKPFWSRNRLRFHSSVNPTTVEHLKSQNGHRDGDSTLSTTFFSVQVTFVVSPTSRAKKREVMKRGPIHSQRDWFLCLMKPVLKTGKSHCCFVARVCKRCYDAYVPSYAKFRCWTPWASPGIYCTVLQ